MPLLLPLTFPSSLQRGSLRDTAAATGVVSCASNTSVCSFEVPGCDVAVPPLNVTAPQFRRPLLPALKATPVLRSRREHGGGGDFGVQLR